MANSKQKPVPEGGKRSPGKSKFSIPRKEAPPIDGSYLDRLFADYERQTQGLENADTGAATRPPEVVERPPVIEQIRPEVEENAGEHVLQTTSGDDSLQTGPIVSIPFPVEAAPPQEVVETSGTKLTDQTMASLQLTPPPVIEAPVRDQALPPPGEMFPDEEQIVQKLVKVHRLSKGEAGVLKSMLRLCHERGSDTCYIKIPLLMAVTGLKDRQIQRVLKSLSELGFIERLAEYSNADRLGIQYKVTIPRP